MGTWGVGPFDNDDAADMIAKFMKPVHIVATRKSNESASYYYNEARAAAQILLLSHGTDILGGPGLLPVVRALARMRADTQWLARYRDPKQIAKAVDAELDAAFNRIRGCGRCKKDIEIEALVKAAHEVPVPPSAQRGRLPRRTTGSRRVKYRLEKSTGKVRMVRVKRG